MCTQPLRSRISRIVAYSEWELQGAPETPDSLECLGMVPRPRLHIVLGLPNGRKQRRRVIGVRAAWLHLAGHRLHRQRERRCEQLRQARRYEERGELLGGHRLGRHGLADGVGHGGEHLGEVGRPRARHVLEACLEEFFKLGVVRQQDGLRGAGGVARVDECKLVLCVCRHWQGVGAGGFNLARLPQRVAHEHVWAEVDDPGAVVLDPLLNLGMAARVNTRRVERNERLAGGRAHGALDASVLGSLQECDLIVVLRLVARLGDEERAINPHERVLEAGGVAKVTLHECDVGQRCE
mmetsp:Transcript_40832/g.121904  ORF Transcript_40832/g.121904 Transcript_40832/m.121904 type:complete len:295 (+) Transcript_40832:418-1302(+)